MTVQAVAALHARAQARATAAAVGQARTAWGALGDTPLATWDGGVGEALYVAISQLQLRTAAQADGYVDRVMREQGIDTNPAGPTVGKSLAGRASDGRDLESLLREPVKRADQALSRGVPRQQAMPAFRYKLERIAATQVTDAGRVADGIAITARPEVAGYVRALAPPSCGRCAILAGRVYRWSSGFARHPICDCRHIPTTENNAKGLTVDPEAYFNSLTPEQQSKWFGAANSQAIRDGADMNRVVNATGRTGAVYTAGGRKYTTEATRGKPRPTPEQIYREVKGRSDAIRLLRRYGYIA